MKPTTEENKMPGSNPPDLEQQAAVLTLEEAAELGGAATDALLKGAHPKTRMCELPQDNNEEDKDD